MAEDKRADELIAYVHSLGFKGEKLEADIRRGYGKSNAAFAVRHRIGFGDEMIQYNLRFRFDRIFNAYRLDGYKVIYRDPLVIEHETFHGIDTEALEEKMKTIDWDGYFSRPRAVQTEALPDVDGTDLEAIREVERQVYRLGEMSDYGAQEIQGQLMFKYWSEEFWSDDSPELHSAYGNTMDFEATEYGLPNAILAFSIVSGRFERIRQMVARTGIPEQYPDMDIENILARHLSGNPDSFEIRWSAKEAGGIIDFSIPFYRTEDGYHADTNTVTLTAWPELVHGTFNGIDSGSLEEEFKNVNWLDGELYIEDEDDQVHFLPPVDGIIQKISQLSGDKVGKTIADYLQMKYLSYSALDWYIEEPTRDASKGWPQTKRNFPLDYHVKAIGNLMCGRAVVDRTALRLDPGSGVWLKLDLTGKDNQCEYPLQRITGFTKDELERQLKMLSVETIFFYDVRDGLFNGEVMETTLRSGHEVILVANPSVRAIDIHTAGMEKIPFNFHLDPKWRPDDTGQKQANESKQRASQSKAKHSGHGKRQ